MEQSDQSVDAGGLEDRRPPHPQQRSGQGFLDVLGAFGGAVGNQNGQGQSDRVGNADDRLLGYPLVSHPRHRKDGGADDGEGEGEAVGGLAVWAQSQQEAEGRAQSSDLRQCEIHEDDLSLDHMQAEVGMNTHQDHAGRERCRHQLDQLSHSATLWSLRRP